jgi:hypothetical protein
VISILNSFPETQSKTERDRFVEQILFVLYNKSPGYKFIKLPLSFQSSFYQKPVIIARCWNFIDNSELLNLSIKLQSKVYCNFRLFYNAQRVKIEKKFFSLLHMVKYSIKSKTKDHIFPIINFSSSINWI